MSDKNQEISSHDQRPGGQESCELSTHTNSFGEENP